MHRPFFQDRPRFKLIVTATAEDALRCLHLSDACDRSTAFIVVVLSATIQGHMSCFIRGEKRTGHTRRPIKELTLLTLASKAASCCSHGFLQAYLVHHKSELDQFLFNPSINHRP